MSGPIAWITTFEIHEGRLEAFKEIAAKAMEFAEANGPQLMLGVYIDEKEMRAHGFQVHRDSASILAYWKLADPYMKEAMQHITTKRVDFYGQPSEEVMERMRQIVTTGAKLTVTPRFAGFARFAEP